VTGPPERPPLRLIGLSGSLRAASTNRALLLAAARAAPETARLDLFQHLAGLPIFNPDLEQAPPAPALAALRRQISDADGLVIASPEYAHGIAGGLKNALDWLVSGSEIPGKPVALLHASLRSAISRAALTEVLRTMSVPILVEATVPLLGLDPEAVAARLAEAPTRALLGEAMRDFATAIAGLRQGPATPLDRDGGFPI
jgi:NAD(P)H-dependent FMN reductase